MWIPNPWLGPSRPHSVSRATDSDHRSRQCKPTTRSQRPSADIVQFLDFLVEGRIMSWYLDPADTQVARQRTRGKGEGAGVLVGSWDAQELDPGLGRWCSYEGTGCL